MFDFFVCGLDSVGRWIIVMAALQPFGHDLGGGSTPLARIIPQGLFHGRGDRRIQPAGRVDPARRPATTDATDRVR